jgi:hypothetical protein
MSDSFTQADADKHRELAGGPNAAGAGAGITQSVSGETAPQDRTSIRLRRRLRSPTRSPVSIRGIGGWLT